MAMSTPIRKTSRKMTLKLMMVVMFSWLIIFIWIMSLWFRLGFSRAQEQVSRFSNQQMMSSEFKTFIIPRIEPLKPFNDLTLKIQDKLETITQNNATISDALNFIKRLGLIIKMTNHIMLIKLTILITALPLFSLMMIAGLIDGLNQRAIRTASLGRESSYIFHQLNRYFKQGFILLLAFWFAIPFSVTPSFIFVPMSIVLSVMMSITASRFKKYI
jgi:hypothetical protein